jgi:hypothetical protein
MENIYPRLNWISLGYNCDPRTDLKNQYETSRSNGYLTHPFDLCISPPSAVEDLLEHNFETFFKGLRVCTWGNALGNRSNAGPGGTAITNDAGIIFNHEGGAHSHLFAEGRNDDEFYIRNNFYKFRQRYEKRIENFKNTLRNYNKIYFLHKKSSEYPKLLNLNSITNIINKHYGDKKIEFINII